jgi:hypothetical protein
MPIYEDGIPASYDDIGGDAPCVFCGQYRQGKDAEGMCSECWYLLDWGVRAERERIIKLLEPHRITDKSVGGFLGVCFCGEAMDDYQEHLLALIKGEK